MTFSFDSYRAHDYLKTINLLENRTKDVEILTVVGSGLKTGLPKQRHRRLHAMWTNGEYKFGSTVVIG